MGIVPLTKTESEPDIAWVTAPLASIVHRERIFTHAMPLETTAESNTRLAGQEPTTSGSCGDPGRPFTLKNLEIPGNFSGKGTPMATTWLTEMSRWIHLSKVPNNDLWAVVATRMSGGALTWMNTKLNVAKQWGGGPLPEWQAFVTALKAQFEPLSREERAREQIRNLR